MRIKNISIHEYGPIEKLDQSFEFDVIGLVGPNGSGKTTILSIILDLALQIKGIIFSETNEVKQGKLFKPLSKKSIRFSSNAYGMFRIDFRYNEKDSIFYEILKTSEIDISELPIKMPSIFSQEKIEEGMKKDFLPRLATNAKEFDSFIFNYYPAGRYEKPNWIGENIKFEFNTKPKYIDQDNRSLWRTNIIENISNWIIDIVLDVELYDVEYIMVTYPDQTRGQAKKPINGKNRRILENLNNILTEIINSSSKKYSRVRLAIGERFAGGRSLNIIAVDKSHNELNIATTLSALSTGELGIFCLFADILYSAELTGWDGQKIEDIKGVVLIDEIDSHLHINLQNKIVNKIFELFKGIQFIFTTHSPFLLSSLTKDNQIIIDVQNNSRIEPEEYNEFQTALSHFKSFNDNYQIKYSELKKELDKSQTPLIITEGKTDWRHLKIAYDQLLIHGKISEIKFNFHEYDTDMGDTELKKYYQSIIKTNTTRKIICLFDRDNHDIIKFIENLKNNGENNVYAMCIELPSHRKNIFESISIEHLYLDKDLMRYLSESQKRLRFYSEIFSQQGDKTKNFLNPHAEINSNLRIYDQDVALLSNIDGSKKGELALSKNSFLEEIVSLNKNDIDFSGFISTFNKIESIINK